MLAICPPRAYWAESAQSVGGKGEDGRLEPSNSWLEDAR